MRKILLVFYLTMNSIALFAQITLTIEGTIVNDTITGVSTSVYIPRDQPTFLTYKNNSITSVNAGGYMLHAGEEIPTIRNNNLDGAIITGNKFIWNGSGNTSTSHAVFTGYNINVVMKYNYLKKTTYGLLRKSNGMTNTSGGVAYNIVIDPRVGCVAKGINNVNVYNNTFYSSKTTAETWRGLIDIYTNTDLGLNAPSTGTKVFNNIFYTKHQIRNIFVYETEDLIGFESDYNVFWCEDGAPMFRVADSDITFAEWQALGYDTHSVVINPNFKNFTEFVPTTRLNYGTNLGSEWQTGLSTTATWVAGTSPETTNQNGTWQVGARVYRDYIPVSTITVSGAGGATAISTDNGTLQLSAAVLPANATNPSVTWSIVNGTGQATIDAAGLVTAFDNGTVTARAKANDGSGIFGTLELTILNQIIPVSTITVSGAGGATSVTTDNGTLQLSAAVLPANATNPSVIWSIVNGTGQATISAMGLVTAVDNGTVTARATAKDGSGIFGMLVLTISDQIIPVSTITVSGAADATSITTDKGTLQLSATVLPANATNPSVTWSIVNGTGQATISATGLVTAANNGTVTVRATAKDGSGIFGTLELTLSNQVTLSADISDNEGKGDSLPIIVTRSELIIMLDYSFFLCKAELYNLQGVLISGKHAESGGIIFEISRLPSGIYFVVLSKGLNNKVIKVLKP